MSSYLSWQKRCTSLKSTFPISFHWWLVTGISEYGECSLATITKSQCNNLTRIRKSAPKHSLPESSFNRSGWRLWEIHIRMPVDFVSGRTHALCPPSPRSDYTAVPGGPCCNQTHFAKQEIKISGFVSNPYKSLEVLAVFHPHAQSLFLTGWPGQHIMCSLCACLLMYCKVWMGSYFLVFWSAHLVVGHIAFPLIMKPSCTIALFPTWNSNEPTVAKCAILVNLFPAMSCSSNILVL